MKTITLLLILLVSSIAHCNSDLEAKILDWSAKHKISLDSLESAKAKESIKAFLKKELNGKRFVHLGEGDHFIHEKWRYRFLFMEALMELGYTNILDERGHADGKRIHEYLSTGKIKSLHSVCYFGFCGGNNGAGAFAQEELRFYNEVRALSVKLEKPLTYLGWDVDPNTKNGYKDVRRLLKVAAENSPQLEALINKLTAIISEHTGNRPDDEAKALEIQLKTVKEVEYFYKSINQNKKELRKGLSKKQFVELYWDSRNLYSSHYFLYKYLKFRKGDDSKSKSDNTYQFFNAREPLMIDLLRYKLNAFEDTDKFIVFGHNSHLLKRSFQFTVSYESMKDYPMWYPMGEWITDNYPGEVYMVWLGLGKGEHEDIACDSKVCVSEPPEGTIESIFVKDSKTPWIASLKNTNSPLGDNTLFSAQMVETEKGNLNIAADAYFFIPQTTRMKKYND